MAWSLLIEPISRLLDKIIPDPIEREKAKLELLKEERQYDLDQMKTSMSAIIAEATSQDPWTSRARPSFLYLFYFILFVLIIIAPIIGIFVPDQMDKFYSNVDKGFQALPEELWWTFTTGYLGYAGMRSIEKVKNKS